ncbi:MAG TPA: alcohol dehydrogenase catalytic domain-containing protein [Acidimicrobiia bacterium]|nr:alcohol dehydrogenase catalytic domain-containing protein [Acidimicrobiia bacterium]
MRAAVFVGEGQDLSIEDVEAMPPGPNDVIVRIGASGVCHSDLSATNGSLPMPPPCILGHEGAGVVEEVGSGVQRLRPGDRVVASFVPNCGHCFFCLHGQANLCDQTLVVSMAHGPSGQTVRSRRASPASARSRT